MTTNGKPRPDAEPEQPKDSELELLGKVWIEAARETADRAERMRGYRDLLERAINAHDQAVTLEAEAWEALDTARRTATRGGMS